MACFGFDNTTADSIGNIGAATVIGNPTFATGVEGDAIVLDGDDNLAFGPDADLDVTQMTFDAWLNATAPDSGRSGIGDIEGHFGLFLHPGGEIRCVVAGTGTLSSLATSTTVSDGTWHHVACRHTPGRGYELFVDGDVVDCATTANALGTSAEPFMIGANSPDNASALLGSIDSLRFWSSELTDQQLCEAAGRSSCAVVAAGCNLP